jgi:hypothetical protein
MSEHKYIWLQPECCADPDEGRHWCQDPDPVDCDDGEPWTKYILVSEHESLERQLADAHSQLQQAREERDTGVRAFADGVIALITAEQAAMSRLYSKHEYGINKVCNRLKLFVGDLLKDPLPAAGEVDKNES